MDNAVIKTLKFLKNDAEDDVLDLYDMLIEAEENSMLLIDKLQKKIDGLKEANDRQLDALVRISTVDVLEKGSQNKMFSIAMEAIRESK